MNTVQIMGKLGIYQFKVFISCYFKLRTGKYSLDKVEGLYKAKYLFKWQYNALLKRSDHK